MEFIRGEGRDMPGGYHKKQITKHTDIYQASVRRGNYRIQGNDENRSTVTTERIAQD
jgi:hypothetical protein